MMVEVGVDAPQCGQEQRVDDVDALAAPTPKMFIPSLSVSTHRPYRTSNTSSTQRMHSYHLSQICLIRYVQRLDAKASMHSWDFQASTAPTQTAPTSFNYGSE